MLDFILWYIIISSLGLLTFPLAYSLLPALADRGYVFSRALGWLLWGYIFWMLGSLGVIQNNVGGELLSLLVIVGFVYWSVRQVGWDEIKDWFRTQRRLVLTVEILFFIAFAGWAMVRAANPDIVGTEKPMELAFINSILRSPTLPPNDPWLSGYAISYYYFGYVLVAMLAKLAGTTGGVAFNLGGALVFALSAIGSYGLLYNLLNKREKEANSQLETSSPLPAPRPEPCRRDRSPLTALLAPFFILIVSNLGGLLHLLRLGGIFWRTDESGVMTSPIWSWLDMGRFSDPPPAESFPHWWWWQASRVIQDFDFNWVNKGDIIDEFPFFSYLLGDLHPHVLTMPFAFLAMAMAFNLFLHRGKEKLPWSRLNLSPSFFFVSGVVFGGMAFLNTWDAPFYVALFAGAYILRCWILGVRRWTVSTLLKDFLVVGFTLGIASIILYLPFYLGFASQAGGPLPNVIYVTRGIYLWLMFAPLLIPIFAYLFYLWRKDADGVEIKRGLQVTLGFVLILWLVSLAITGIISLLHLVSNVFTEAANASSLFLGSLAAPSWSALFKEGFIRRLTVPGTLLTLVALLTLVIASLWPHKQQDGDTSPHPSSLAPSHYFSLLLTLIAGLLVLAPEFVYLRDMFGYRINTIFKFYFLAWLMWGIVAAYATVVLWGRLSSSWKIVFRIGMILILGLALIYPVLGLWTKTDGFNPPQWTLDGTAYLQRNSPDEAAAMIWLSEAPLGIVAEAVGGSYTTFARMASHSGQPTVLGWEFHEIQWRGGTKEMGSRKADIERLYCTPSWDEARQILEQYDIRYVVVGIKERIEYAADDQACPTGLGETKFIRNLPVAFEQGELTIFEVPWQE